MTDEEFISFIHNGSPHWINKGFKDIKMPKYQDKDCCYEQMANGGKEGGQSITKIDNSIHSKIWDEPMCNNYEMTRKGWNANGYDQSGMKGK